MALKVSKGVMSLSHLPKRIKVAAVLAVAFSAALVLWPATGGTAPSEKLHSVASAGKTERQAASGAAGDGGASAGVVKTGKIVTCPRCRLNSLPLVKKFVHTHAKLFEPQLKVDFILGEDPVLHLYENGKEVKKIDLEPFGWKEIIQKLVAFGIKPTKETEEIREALKSS